MTVLFVEPDELKTGSRFPALEIQTVKCAGLEERTGSDFVISSLPSYPLQTKPFSDAALKWHLENNSLFVQRKSGYDALSFDNLKRSIARAQKCGIPPWQFKLLCIGNYVETKSGGLAVVGQKPFGKTTFETFLVLKAKWDDRGGSLDWIEKESQLEIWINARVKSRQDIQKEGKRELFPHAVKPFEEREHILQDVVEIGENDWRYLLCAGLKDFGIKKANYVRDYCLEHFGMACGYYALKTMTQANEKNKAVHKISGWGKVSFQKLRAILGLPPGYNIFVSDMFQKDDRSEEFTRGVFAGTAHARRLVKDGEKNGWKVLEKVEKAADEFFSLTEYAKGKRIEALTTEIRELAEDFEKFIDMAEPVLIEATNRQDKMHQLYTDLRKMLQPHKRIESEDKG